MINLFSDTATKPSRAMFEAMMSAALGDEQRRDDTTTNQLEQEVAELVGQEQALLLPTATMANQVALSILTTPGTELICHESAHIYNFEGGGLAALSGIQVRALQGSGGCFDGDAVRAALRPRDPHFPASRAVSIENTSNQGGGTVWPDDAFFSVVRTCKEHGLKLHIDGARLFNAAIKKNVAVSHWGSQADTIQLCFSKGLGCPFGAVLASSAANIDRARDVKQRFGGALRQAGVIAGAMLYALHNHVDGLKNDHQKLKRIARALQASEKFELWPYETNILYFRPKTKPPETFASELEQNGVLVSLLGGRLRLCTHRDIDSEQVDAAIATLMHLATS